MHIPNSTAEISCLLGNTIIGRAANEVSDELEFPRETANLIALSIASFTASLGYCVCYPNGEDTLPIGLYTLAEQPSGSGKSSVCTKLSRGLRSGIDTENDIRRPIVSQIMKSKADTKGDLSDYELEQLMENHMISQPISNTTPEALDVQLSKQGGWFCLTSTEQGLLDTLVGGMYSEGKSSFDLMLKGFNAESHKELRVTRETYDGAPHGGAMCVSQEGSITTVLDSSGSTGLVERFLMIIEGDMRGHRTFKRDITPTTGYLVKEFNKKCESIIHHSFPKRRELKFESLKKIHLSKDSWSAINEYRFGIEKHLGSGGRYNANIFSSMWSKFDIQVMKISATLHLFCAKDVNMPVPLSTVNIAMALVSACFVGVVEICEMKGIVGKSAEQSDVEAYFCKNCKGMGKQEREILDSLRKRKIFKQYGNQARTKAKDSIDSLVEMGVIQIVISGNITRYRMPL